MPDVEFNASQQRAIAILSVPGVAAAGVCDTIHLRYRMGARVSHVLATSSQGGSPSERYHAAIDSQGGSVLSSAVFSVPWSGVDKMTAKEVCDLCAIPLRDIAFSRHHLFGGKVELNTIVIWYDVTDPQCLRLAAYAVVSSLRQAGKARWSLCSLFCWFGAHTNKITFYPSSGAAESGTKECIHCGLYARWVPEIGGPQGKWIYANPDAHRGLFAAEPSKIFAYIVIWLVVAGIIALPCLLFLL